MEHITELLSDYLDGELNHHASRQVDEHLAGCDRCRCRLRALRRTVRFVQHNGRVPIKPGSAAAGIDRFNRELMSRDATQAELLRIMLEESQRVLARPAADQGGEL